MLVSPALLLALFVCAIHRWQDFILGVFDDTKVFLVLCLHRSR